MDLWRSSQSPCHDWYWHYPEFPNGWSPLVSDHSQASAPTRPTSYQVSAASRHQLVQSAAYPTLAEAKSAAILFAMEQRDAEEVYAEWIRFHEERRKPSDG
jgi:hypothetical protein